MIDATGSNGPNAGEIDRWNSRFAEKWVLFQRELDDVFESVSKRLIERARIKAGYRVLDIGCGGGALAAELAPMVGPSGRVVGVDISRPLLAAARKRTAGVGNVDYVLADAQTYGFPKLAFDALVSRFGLMFFGAPVAAFRNMASALRKGGRMTFASWGNVEHNPWFSVPRDAATARLGPPSPSHPRAPGPLAFSDADYVESILLGAGLTEVLSRTEALCLTSRAGLGEVARLASSLGPAARIHEERSGTPEDLEAIERDVAEAFRPFMGDRGFSIPASVNFFSAVGR